MTRDEIENFSVEEPYCFETEKEEDWYKIGCIDGLKAADAEPNLKSLWHKSSEEPKHGEDIIAICDNIPVAGVFTKHLLGKGIFRYHCLLCDWYSPQKWETVDKWAYVSDLLPKGSEE